MKKFQAPVPESTHDRLYALKERLGVPFSELLTWLVDLAEGKIDEVELKAKVKHLMEALEQERKEKDKLLQEYERLVRDYEKLQLKFEDCCKKLQEQLEKSGAIPAREREARDLRDEVQRVLSMYPELKLLELFRRLGYSEKGEALMKKAEAFQKRWFVLEGKVFVSKELGLVLEPSHEVGLLGWKVRKLEVMSDV
ncbi:hypothetical protein A3L14_11040 [Thermococcus thioreducens]|uniref:Uncharacterized protein n=2 Tax=Thermococcus thioreducens TaxID=277988 RepID=A0A0Q2QT76_9EURY|nr:hypothetical protein A3L14_11040 [Thermococcus thioreducens]KQH83213.1 hypothetical protein AMR53_00575 [Thermococcus thioreducens]SEW23579.1 hypothetical protein SAMN05216170_2317 [Thermococcus thioreducens]